MADHTVHPVAVLHRMVVRDARGSCHFFPRRRGANPCAIRRAAIGLDVGIGLDAHLAARARRGSWPPNRSRSRRYRFPPWTWLLNHVREVAFFRIRLSTLRLQTPATRFLAHHHCHRAPAREVQAPDQAPMRPTLGGNRGHAVLGVDGLRADHYPQGRWLIDAGPAISPSHEKNVSKYLTPKHTPSLA